MQDWQKQPEWHGNPELGLESYKKVFKNPRNGRMVPVYIFGKDGKIDTGSGIQSNNYWSFCVSAGPNSDYSYTGGFPDGVVSQQDRQTYVNALYENNRLFK
ncbi:MAG: hypothetical protein WC325_11425 [Candidatus Bathyarchaeia archaeon]|jgi:hypothetical protein